MAWIHLTHFQDFDWCPSLLVGFPDNSVGKASACKAGDPSSVPGSGISAGEAIGLFLGFPSGSAGKESSCKAGELGSIPGLGRSPGQGKGYPLQYSGLENSMDCIVHGRIMELYVHDVNESQTRSLRSDSLQPHVLYSPWEFSRLAYWSG